MTEMVAEHPLRLVENYRERTPVRIARSAFVLAAHLETENNFTLVFVKRGWNMKGIVIQRTATKTIVMVQLLANQAGLSLRIGRHGLFFI